MSAIEDLIEQWNAHHAELLQWRDEVSTGQRASEFETRAYEVSTCIGQLKAALAQQPEPEYEYALRHANTPEHFLGDGRWRTEEAVRRARDNRTWPEEWQIIRRVTAGEWEDVK